MFRRARCTSRLSTPEQGMGTYLICEGREGHRSAHHTLSERWADIEAEASPSLLQSSIPRQRKDSPVIAGAESQDVSASNGPLVTS